MGILLATRRMLLGGRGIPKLQGSLPGSVQALFTAASSLFTAAKPTLDPPFVRPTSASLIMYAAELMHLLMHQTSAIALLPFRLRDDAARAIHELSGLAPASAPELPFAINDEGREALAAEFVAKLMDLNLSLPPEPEAKHAPVVPS